MWQRIVYWLRNLLGKPAFIASFTMLSGSKDGNEGQLRVRTKFNAEFIASLDQVYEGSGQWNKAASDSAKIALYLNDVAAGIAEPYERDLGLIGNNRGQPNLDDIPTMTLGGPTHEDITTRVDIAKLPQDSRYTISGG